MPKIAKTSTTSLAGARRLAEPPAGDALDRRLPVIASDPGSLALPAAAHVASLKASMQLRTMELVGLAEDGRMYLWQTGNVQPVDRFETVLHGRLRCIKSGHYVLDIAGHAIVAHCSAMADGRVGIQLMCNNGPVLYAPRANVEAILLGRMVRDEAAELELVERMEALLAGLQERQRAPHRARGAIL